MILNYNEFGEGQPIIILHGLFGSARNWQGIARGLASDYRVITVDLRNHGQSPHTDSMSYHEMAKDITTLIKHLKLSNIILIGHSMGGKVAMTLGLTEPEQLGALVITDIAPVSYEHDFTLITEAMISLPLATIKNRSDADLELSRSIKEKSLRQFIIQNLTRTDAGFKWRINLQKITANLALIRQFPESLNDSSSRLPSLFLGGSESDYLKNSYRPAIFKFFPAAEIRIIEGTGHYLHAEKPTEFLQALKAFINYTRDT